MTTGTANRASRPLMGALVVTMLLILTLATAKPVVASSLSVTSAQLTGFAKTYGAPVTCILTAVADSYVNKALPGTNFGTAVALLTSPDTVATERAFVRFDLGTCSPSIPSGAIVQSASLKLTVAVLATGTRTIDLRSASASWTETGVTWTSQPSVAGSTTASVTVSAGATAGTVLTWTATSDVQSFVSGASTNFGWRLGDSSEGVVAGPILTLDSKEAASGKPQLVVTYVS